MVVLELGHVVDIAVDDNVQIAGLVMRRYVATGKDLCHDGMGGYIICESAKKNKEVSQRELALKWKEEKDERGREYIEAKVKVF